jgi:hypothetical protein
MRNEIAVRSKADLLLDPAVWGLIREQASILLKSTFLPSSVKTPEQAIAIMIKGVELNIPPMQSFQHIFVINGKTGISAELMLSLIFRAIPNLAFVYKRRDDTACIITVTRPGGRPEEFSFSIEDAKKAMLLNNPTWSKYPRAMLRSRCISEMARSLFPDLLMGATYTPEELGANVSEDGTVIDIKVETPSQSLPEPKISSEELRGIFSMINTKKNSEKISDDFRKLIKEKYNIENTKDLTRAQYVEVVSWIGSLPEETKTMDETSSET